MALKAMADNNVNITAQEDARLYDYLAGQNADYVIQGVGDSLAVSSTTTSLLVTLGSGEAVVQGRHLTNTDSTGVQLTLPQNTTAYLVLRLDLSKSLGNELSFISTPSLEDDDLNNAGVVRDLVLYQYITDANGVATLTDKRNFKTNQTEINDSQTTANNTWSAQKIQNQINLGDYDVYYFRVTNVKTISGLDFTVETMDSGSVTFQDDDIVIALPTYGNDSSKKKLLEIGGWLFKSAEVGTKTVTFTAFKKAPSVGHWLSIRIIIIRKKGA